MLTMSELMNTNMNELKIKNLRKEVESMLAECAVTRNSDQLLTLKLWVKLFPDKIIKAEDGSQAVKLKDIMLLPREDNVKRVRAKIQNEEHKYLPTTEAVRKARGISEEVWYKYNLYN